jgi:NAD(P)-dependent dehydrogenase (short-subunit alcohol dehydrogenase family)
MAVSFARAGASMIAISARSGLSGTAQAIQDAAAQAGKSAPRVLPLEFDVTDRKSVDGVAHKVREEFGRLDVLVNNAGRLRPGTITDADPDEWVGVWNVKLIGPSLLMRAFIPFMLEGGDKTIVTISSVGGLLHVPGLSAYQIR